MLPDEIISEILSPALKVSEDLFSDVSDVSPFSDYTPSTSAYLLVCKDWLRVATPLLYNVVVLRSKSQANALETVLKSNREFGQFIKKLRVEGGYGLAMHTILKSAPNVTDLVLSFSIWSSDGTEGLCKGLRLIDPHRVIVLDPYTGKVLKNKQLAALKRTLFARLRVWKNLVCILNSVLSNHGWLNTHSESLDTRTVPPSDGTTVNGSKKLWSLANCSRKPVCTRWFLAHPSPGFLRSSPLSTI